MTDGHETDLADSDAEANPGAGSDRGREPARQKLLRVGCPMWANRAWVGPYFPSSTPSGDELAAYATWCNTVEGNTTFYAVPKAETVERWSEGAPSDFRFCFKVPRHITHERRLRNIAEPLSEFLHVLTPLHDRLGPLQFQLPAASLRPTFQCWLVCSSISLADVCLT